MPRTPSSSDGATVASVGPAVFSPAAAPYR